MLGSLLIALSAGSAAPAQMANEYAAIWYDLQVNAMIGNGNWPASLWMNAGSALSGEEKLQILDLRCGKGARKKTCTFTLFRDGGPKPVQGEIAPDRLSCKATFVWSKDKGWDVLHYPPRRTGHSRTSMVCTDPAVRSSGA